MVNKTNTSAQSKELERFSIKVGSLVLFLFLFSCEKEEAVDKVIEQSIELQIENEKFKLENEIFVPLIALEMQSRII
jgi:hypothetical protein